MKRFSKVVRSGHGGRMGNSSSGREDPVITDRLRAEDFVFTKVCNLLSYRSIDRRCILAHVVPRPLRTGEQDKAFLPPAPPGVLLSLGVRTIDQLFAQKQKLKIDCNFQFRTFFYIQLIVDDTRLCQWFSCQ